MHVEPEAEYTDAACVPYTASALAIGEESIYVRCAAGLSRNGRGEDPTRFTSPVPREAKIFGDAGAQNSTTAASNTGPSTHTRFIAGPVGRFTRTVQPAQPPTAQAMYSSSDSCAGRP